jgi:hypothetical protein
MFYIFQTEPNVSHQVSSLQVPDHNFVCIFSRSQKFKLESSELWRRVALWQDNNVSEVHAASIFRAARSSDTLGFYRINARRHNPEDYDVLEVHILWFARQPMSRVSCLL